MRRTLRIFVWVLAIVVILTSGLFAYLQIADLSVYEEQIEGLLSDAIGHQLEVDGSFELRFGGKTRVMAEKITLSNSDWQPDPVILSIGHLSATVDAWSLVFGPVIIESLDAREVDLRLERNAESRANWRSGKTGAEFGSEWFAFKEVEIQDVQFSFTDPARRRPLQLTLDHLTVNPDQNKVLDVNLSGMIDEFPLQASGRFGPWGNLIEGTETMGDLDLTFGPVRLKVEGTIADLAALAGVEASLGFSGPAIERVAEVLGLPPFAEGEFRVDARIRESNGGSQLSLDGHLGSIEIFLSGSVDELMRPQRAEFDYTFSGPDSRYVAEVFGIKGAAAAPFRISGDLKKRGSRYDVSGLRVRLAHGEIDARGWIDLNDTIPDGDLIVSATGPDLSLIGPFAGIARMPAEPFDVSGRIQKSGADWRFDDFTAKVGENQIDADGQLGGQDPAANEIRLSITGPDLSMLQPMIGLRGLPSGPFDVSARVKKDRAGILLEDGKAVFGDYRLDVDGVIGTGKGLTGTKMRVRGEGPELENVALLTEVLILPSGPFEFEGDVRIDRGLLYVGGTTRVAGGAHASADGTFGLGDDLGEYDLEVAAGGSDVANLMHGEWLQRLSGEAFEFSGHLNHRDSQYQSAISGTIGQLEIGVDAGLTSGGEAGVIRFTASSPDSGALRKLTGFKGLPDGAVSASGSIEKTDAELKFTDAKLRVGEYSFAVDGTLSTEPLSDESEFRFSISGPDLREFGMQSQFEGMPALPFRASGEFNGTPAVFTVENLVGSIGDSDISGRYTADLRDKPEVTGILASSFLDLTAFLSAYDIEAADGEKASEFLIPNEPLHAHWLQTIDVDVVFKADQLRVQPADLQDFVIDVRLQDGRLDIDRVSFRESGGRVSGSVHLEPTDGRYVVGVLLNADDARLGLLAAPDQDRTTLPPIGGRLELRGTGNSLHELIASSNGEMSFTLGAGRLKDMVSSRIFGDLLLQIIRTLNPLRSPEEYTTLECARYGVDIEDGVATIREFAVQTNRIAIVARGNVDFESERLDLYVQAVPREGMGISLGSVANSILKLGGTIKDPRLAPTRTAPVMAGAAVASGGAALIVKSLWERAGARADICKG